VSRDLDSRVAVSSRTIDGQVCANADIRADADIGANVDSATCASNFAPSLLEVSVMPFNAFFAYLKRKVVEFKS
jgi:hypothetical protein